MEDFGRKDDWGIIVEKNRKALLNYLHNILYNRLTQCFLRITFEILQIKILFYIRGFFVSQLAGI